MPSAPLPDPGTGMIGWGGSCAAAARLKPLNRIKFVTTRATRIAATSLL
jgi:hypothetical protein